MKNSLKSVWAENSLPKIMFNRCYAAVKKLYPDLQKIVSFSEDLSYSTAEEKIGCLTFGLIVKQCYISFSAKHYVDDPNFVLSVMIHEFGHLISYYKNVKYGIFDKKHPNYIADDGHNAIFRKHCAILVDKICTNDEKRYFYLYAGDGPVDLNGVKLYFDKDNNLITNWRVAKSNDKLKTRYQFVGNLETALKKYPEQTVIWINDEENRKMKKSDGKYYYKQPFAEIF